MILDSTKVIMWIPLGSLIGVKIWRVGWRFLDSSLKGFSLFLKNYRVMIVCGWISQWRYWSSFLCCMEFSICSSFISFGNKFTMWTTKSYSCLTKMVSDPGLREKIDNLLFFHIFFYVYVFASSHFSVFSFHVYLVQLVCPCPCQRACLIE